MGKWFGFWGIVHSRVQSVDSNNAQYALDHERRIPIQNETHGNEAKESDQIQIRLKLLNKWKKKKGNQIAKKKRKKKQQ